MNYFFSICLLSFLILSPKATEENQQQGVLKSILNIEEFQNYLATPPRFVGTSLKQEILIKSFPELQSQELKLTVGNKSVRVISEEEINMLKHNFFITVDEFLIKKSTAHVILSYQNAKMYYEKKQKVLLEVKLGKDKTNKWGVKNYNIDEVSINTSD